MVPDIPLVTAITVVLLCLSSVFSISQSVRPPRQEIIKKLFDRTASLQAKTDVPYKTLRTWKRQKGAYRSHVKINFHGELALAEMRRLFNVDDNNMFVTAWVTTSLLEASRYQQAVRPSSWQLGAALDAIYSHRDLNAGYNSSAYGFWQQQFNQTTDFWSSTPVNLLGVLTLTDKLPMNLLVGLLADLGFKGLAKSIEGLVQEKSTLQQAFHIPPDFDDTFVNLGLGALLYQMKSTYPDAWNKWHKYNNNITSAFDDLKKYAYRPFSKDSNANSIDPRSYYVIRDLLDQAYSAGEDLALVTTWIENIDEDRIQFHKGVAMPFQVTNVDIAVSANTVVGITSSILAGIVKGDVLNDADIAQIYLNTSSLIAHELKTNISDRPDLALLYYPSQMEFDWFVTRTVDQMQTFLLAQPLPHPVMQTVYTILKNATEGAMTETIVSKAKTDEDKDVFFDDFLGNADVTLDKKPMNRAEDRIFTTAMAANALLYTWTICDNQGKCRWKKAIPDKVLSTINGSINWLTRHALDGKYDPWNVFFSGSAKGFGSLPFWYPANRLEFLNGTVITNWKHLPNSVDYLLAMRGYVQKADYDTMLQKPHFGANTPRTFHGFNDGSGGFPLWSSDAYTYSVTLLALSRYENVIS